MCRRQHTHTHTVCVGDNIHTHTITMCVCCLLHTIATSPTCRCVCVLCAGVCTSLLLYDVASAAPPRHRVCCLCVLCVCVVCVCVCCVCVCSSCFATWQHAGGGALLRVLSFARPCIAPPEPPVCVCVHHMRAHFVQRMPTDALGRAHVAQTARTNRKHRMQREQEIARERTVQLSRVSPPPPTPPQSRLEGEQESKLKCEVCTCNADVLDFMPFCLLFFCRRRSRSSNLRCERARQTCWTS